MGRRILCRKILYFLPVLFQRQPDRPWRRSLLTFPGGAVFSDSLVAQSSQIALVAQFSQIALVAYFSHSSSSPSSQGEIFSKTMA